MHKHQTGTYGGAGALEGGASGEAIGLRGEREVQRHNGERSAVSSAHRHGHVLRAAAGLTDRNSNHF